MIIPLGEHCNITFLNQSLGLKKATSLFEYFESGSLQDITNIINTKQKFGKCNIGNYPTRPGVFILNVRLFSFHYINIDEYKDIFQRRYNRFIENINKAENIYFVRVDSLGKITTKNQIELFIESIKQINPNIKFNFLLISTIHTNSNIKPIAINIPNIIFHHKFFFNKDINCVYMMKNSEIMYEKYKIILEEIGYNTNDTNSIIFNDKM
jgi:hypothetical protein